VPSPKSQWYFLVSLLQEPSSTKVSLKDIIPWAKLVPMHAEGLGVLHPKNKRVIRAIKHAFILANIYN
jgi:hypothetical protein